MFIQLLMVFCLMDCLVQPLMTGLLAEGNIRVYEIALVVLNIGNVFFYLHRFKITVIFLNAYIGYPSW